MSSHFSPKLLAFYAIAIGSVVTLFSVTSAYGEAHLKAPDRIDGHYPLADSLPGCLAGQSLTLNIQQSGVYLTGTLLPSDVDEATERIANERPSLTGKWQQEQLTLSGPLPYLEACQDPVSIQGTIQNDRLEGTLSLDAAAQKAAFSAEREAPKAAAAGH